MEAHTLLIQPIIALVIWSLVMWLWMYLTRLPAIATMKMKMDPDTPSGVQMSLLPARVRWKADNYNHLMEQPTVFYAVAISLAVIGEPTDVTVMAAWVYVGLRVVHSLVQALGNKIELRFLVFIMSNIPLMLLTWQAARAAFGGGS
ncbi:MAPEG family protein [Endozoicomonas sp. 4G]|uniref:MAPEG family protein n=1 Tax=Endozoicomonas sp. 4G TaxID=2872754 RepID=UPI0020788074|nr:MAPEG family protein [Endozoicomonas sp. 4G]